MVAYLLNKPPLVYNFGMLILNYFSDAIKKYPKECFVSVFLSFVSALVITLVPYLLQYILQNRSDTNVLNIFLIIVLFGVILCLSIYLDIKKFISLDRFGGQYICDLLIRLQDSVLDIDEVKLANISNNQLTHILYADGLEVFRAIGNYLPNLISSLLVLIILFMFSLTIDVRITLWLIAVAWLSILITYYSRRKIRLLASNTNSKLKELHQHIEIFSLSTSFIKLNLLGNYYAEKSNYYVNSFIDCSISEDKVIYWYSGLMDKALLLGQILFSFALSYYLLADTVDILVYTLVFTMAMTQSSRIESLLQSINRSYVSFKNIDQIINCNQHNYGINKINGISEINVDIHSFTYDSSPVLSNVRFSLYKGDALLISGKNGSGKTTLIKLLTNCLSLYDGHIEYNHMTVNTIKRDSLYNCITYISQNDCFIDNTVREYLRLVTRKPITDQQITCAFNRINLELSLNTMLNVAGTTISGGQRKKLQLVRLLLSDLSEHLIILDEVESGLDQQTYGEYNRIANEIIDRKNNILIVIQHSDYSNIHFNKTIQL